eukprot:COSAG06_NODE_1923_length_8061_cov_15.756091_9_plen_201_part_00
MSRLPPWCSKDGYSRICTYALVCVRTPDQGVTPAQLASSSGHVSWAQIPQQHRQDRRAATCGARRASRSQPPPRCSRSAPPTLLIAPAEPDPEGLPSAVRLQPGSETAAQTCLPGRGYLWAGAACCRSLCCGALQCGTCLLWPCCSDRTPARTVFSLATLERGCLWVLCRQSGGCRNVVGGQDLTRFEAAAASAAAASAC